MYAYCSDRAYSVKCLAWASCGSSWRTREVTTGPGNSWDVRPLFTELALQPRVPTPLPWGRPCAGWWGLGPQVSASGEQFGRSGKGLMTYWISMECSGHRTAAKPPLGGAWVLTQGTAGNSRAEGGHQDLSTQSALSMVGSWEQGAITWPFSRPGQQEGGKG